MNCRQLFPSNLVSLWNTLLARTDDSLTHEKLTQETADWSRNYITKMIRMITFGPCDLPKIDTKKRAKELSEIFVIPS